MCQKGCIAVSVVQNVLFCFAGRGAMRFVAVVILALMSMGQASAQRFTGNTVFMAIQCDVGLFADTADKIGLDPRMKSDVDFSWTVEQSTKVETSLGVSGLIKSLIGGPTVKAAKSWKRIDDKHMRGTFNIHERNALACQKNVLKVPLGIRDCLSENTDVLKNGAEASCSTTTVVGGMVSANGDVTLWKVLDIGLGGEYDVKATYTIKIGAPAKEEKKSGVAALE
jgi:hypothetical protein